MNVSIIRRLVILVELQLVTYRRTNRQTGEHRASRHSKYPASKASCAKIICGLSIQLIGTDSNDSEGYSPIANFCKWQFSYTFAVDKDFN